MQCKMESKENQQPSPTSHNKKPKFSLIWNYFDKSVDNKFTECNLCKEEYASGIISNLHVHLKRKHPVIKFVEVEDLNRVREKIKQ